MSINQLKMIPSSIIGNMYRINRIKLVLEWTWNIKSIENVYRITKVYI